MGLSLYAAVMCGLSPLCQLHVLKQVCSQEQDPALGLSHAIDNIAGSPTALPRLVAVCGPLPSLQLAVLCVPGTWNQLQALANVCPRADTPEGSGWPVLERMLSSRGL